jgi:hypothetical protein
MAGLRGVVDAGSDIAGLDLAQLGTVNSLAERTLDTPKTGTFAELPTGCLPLIGAGTLLVAAYLGSNLRPNLLADNDRAGPMLCGLTRRLR